MLPGGAIWKSDCLNTVVRAYVFMVRYTPKATFLLCLLHSGSALLPSGMSDGRGLEDNVSQQAASDRVR